MSAFAKAGGAGAVRVHGGGFAGTVQAYVPEAQVAELLGDIADKILNDEINSLWGGR